MRQGCCRDLKAAAPEGRFAWSSATTTDTPFAIRSATCPFRRRRQRVALQDDPITMSKAVVHQQWANVRDVVVAEPQLLERVQVRQRLDVHHPVAVEVDLGQVDGKFQSGKVADVGTRSFERRPRRRIDSRNRRFRRLVQRGCNYGSQVQVRQDRRVRVFVRGTEAASTACRVYRPPSRPTRR